MVALSERGESACRSRQMVDISLAGRDRILETSRYEESVLIPGVGFGGEGGNGAIGSEGEGVDVGAVCDEMESFDGAGAGRCSEAFFGAYASLSAEIFGRPSLGNF